MWPFPEDKRGPGDLIEEHIKIRQEDIMAFRSPDGTEAVVVSQKPDGTFRYRGYRYDYDEYVGNHWMSYPCAGIYGSAKIAINEANSDLPWLRAALDGLN